ncbi:MFS transporter [soil metagenome]
MVDPPPERSAAAATDEGPTSGLRPTVPLPVVGEGDQPGGHVRLFGTHMFFRLWLAQVVSALGDWLGFLAITILAARVGGGSGASAVGLVMTARILPGFFLAPVAGVMIDRWDRKRVMVACDVGRAAVLAVLPFVDTVLGLVVASLVLEIGTLLWSPAKEASVPTLVPTERLTSANSLALAAAYGTFPVAAALFALLAKVAEWLGGIEAFDQLKVNQESLAFYVDVVTFLISAVMISTLRLPKQRRVTAKLPGRRIDWTGTFHELAEGWHFIVLSPVVRAVNVGLATGLIGGGMVVPLGSVFSIVVLGAGPAGYGVFITALGLGVALGVLGLSLGQKRLPKARVFTLPLFAAWGSLICAAIMTTLAPAALLFAVLGVCAGAVYVLGFTLLHENVEDELRGRIFAALYTVVRLCLLVAFAVGPFLSELLDRLSRNLFDDRRVELVGVEVFLPGVRLTLWLAGLIILAAGGLAASSLRAGLLRSTARTGAPDMPDGSPQPAGDLT